MTKEDIQRAFAAIPVLTTGQYKEFLNVIDITSKTIPSNLGLYTLYTGETIPDNIIANYYS